jgi:hypothetical protein
MIYDRWGQLVFSNFNFPANDPKLGWNGTIRGKQVTPGVYMYFVILEFEDGETKQIYGDVLVLR